MPSLKFRIAKFESKNFKSEVIPEDEFGCRDGEEVIDKRIYRKCRRKKLAIFQGGGTE